MYLSVHYNVFFKKINIFFDPENMKKHPQKLLIIGPLFLCTGPAAQTFQKQKTRTTKSPLMLDWVFRLACLQKLSTYFSAASFNSSCSRICPKHFWTIFISSGLLLFKQISSFSHLIMLWTRIKRSPLDFGIIVKQDHYITIKMFLNPSFSVSSVMEFQLWSGAKTNMDRIDGFSNSEKENYIISTKYA